MNNLSRRNLISLAAAAPLAKAIASATSSKLPALDPAQERARKRVQELHLPNVSLVTHEGRKVRFYDDLMKDKIVSLNFFYSKCDDICPMVIPNLLKVQKILGDQVGRQMFMY